MAFDESLAGRIRYTLARKKNLDEQKMRKPANLVRRIHAEDQVSRHQDAQNSHKERYDCRK